MHIPENYLSPSTCAVFFAAVVPVIKNSIKKLQQTFDRNKLPLLGTAAAYAFLIMMFNVPLIGGTTGHAVGSVLIAILLGPHAACLAVSVALIIQAFFFGDGGILALGANIFNMACVMPFTGYAIYTVLKNKNENIAVLLASYIGINIAALFTALEFGIQPLLFKAQDGSPLYAPYGLSVAIPAMMISHLLIAGILEAGISLAIYKTVQKTQYIPLYESGSSSSSHVASAAMKPAIIFLAILAVLTPLGLLAQGTAWGEWGLEELKELIGYTPQGMSKGFEFPAPFPDYAISGINETLGYIISALFGIAVIMLLAKLSTIIIKRKCSTTV